MANTVVGFDGKTPANLMPSLGSVCPIIPFSVTITGTTTSEDVTFPNIGVIKGVIVQVLDSGNNVVTTDIDVTWSGNVLTLANGSTFDLDASSQVIYGVVWGTVKA